MENGLKILRLQSENVKRVVAVEITPTGELVIISGKNGHGKTSVLDSILYALGGADTLKKTPRPVRDGQERAQVVLDLGDLVVTRHWTGQDKTYLKVTNALGVKQESPQKVLDALLGRLSFDPLAFSQMDADAQVKTLKELCSLDFTALDNEKQQKYDARTLINADAKSYSAQLSAKKPPAQDTPDEEIPAAEAMKKFQAANSDLTSNNVFRSDFKRVIEAFSTTKNEIISIDEEIKKLQERRQEKVQMLGDLKSWGEALQEHIKTLVDPDIDGMAKQMANLEVQNRAVREKKEYLNLQKMHKEKVAASEALTKEIKDIDTKKAALIKKAKMPIEGLGFDESGVTYRGVPFSQASQAEKLRVSVAMAMALNPKIRVIRITDGSLLDADNLKVIEDLAKDKGYQVWIEKVVDGPDGAVGVYIEDGMVVDPKTSPRKPEPEIDPESIKFVEPEMVQEPAEESIFPKKGEGEQEGFRFE